MCLLPWQHGKLSYGVVVMMRIHECVFTCLQFPLGVTNHTLKWEGVWRELGCLARSTSFAVREESGHSLKSALSVSPQLETFSVSLVSLRSCCRSGPEEHVSLASAHSNSRFSAHHVSRFQKFHHFPQQRCLTAAQPGC